LGGIACEFGERPLGLADIAQDVTLEDDLGMRRRLDRNGDARRYLERLTEEAASHLIFIELDRTFPKPAPEDKHRMRADDDDNRHLRLAHFLSPLDVVPKVPAAVQAGADTVGPLHLHAMK